MKRIIHHSRKMTVLHILGYGLLFAVIYEIGTLFFRFGLGMQTTSTTASWLAPLLLGVRIHHLYIGVMLGGVGKFASLRPFRATRNLLYTTAIGMIASDLAHHFVFLKLLTGSCEFDFTYPR
jgi:hypothetical protein